MGKGTEVGVCFPDACCANTVQYPTSSPHVFIISNHEISSFVTPVHEILSITMFLGDHSSGAASSTLMSCWDILSICCWILTKEHTINLYHALPPPLELPGDQHPPCRSSRAPRAAPILPERCPEVRNSLPCSSRHNSTLP
jgi:hypothetical protein